MSGIGLRFEQLQQSTLEQQTTIHQNTPEEWDEVYSTNEFPLAPDYLVSQGLVRRGNYEGENYILGMQIREAVLSSYEGGNVVTCGSGFGRDLTFTPDINERGGIVSACDWSSIACHKTGDYFASLEYGGNRTHQVDLEELFMKKSEDRSWQEKAAIADWENANLVLAALFFQVCDDIQARTILGGLGNWLAQRPGVRKLVMVRPDPKFNNGLPWCHSHPQTSDKLFTLARAGSPRKLEIAGINTGGYFEYFYTATRVMALSK